jgi:hypothetical protein
MHAIVYPLALAAVAVVNVVLAVSHVASSLLLMLLMLVVECVAPWCSVLACCVTWACNHPWAARWMLIVLYGLVGVHGVTCLSCHDGVSGCHGGDSCPFANLPFINSEILRSNGGAHEETTTDAEGAETVITHTLLVAVTVDDRHRTLGFLDPVRVTVRAL